MNARLYAMGGMPVFAGDVFCYYSSFSAILGWWALKLVAWREPVFPSRCVISVLQKFRAQIAEFNLRRLSHAYPVAAVVL